jgi:hypothetical protein
MRVISNLWCCCFLAFPLVASIAFAEKSLAEEKISPEQLKFFEEKIRPVLVRECYGCHSNQVGQVRGGLWLDTAAGMLQGGDSGPAIVPGDLSESLLWNALNHEDFAMPPNKKLPSSILADFQTWIESGAPDPRTQQQSEIRSSITADDIEAGRHFWSFQKPQIEQIPRSSSDWVRNEIDEFIREKLDARGLQPAPDAEPAVVLRRLFFDLIGLPPEPEQVESFEKAYAKNPEKAIAAVVDRLLEQPQFGERWARHWLDVVRYAESTGRELNLTFPNAWRYRDYVIRSFNQDKPYDRFLQEQIAGDLLPVDSDDQWAENLVATGFLAIGPKALTEQNPRQFEWDLVDEQIDVTTRVMLGLSVACARCHDHKFDPIPQTDYYALAGIFRSMSTHYGTFRTLQNRRPSNLIELPISDLNPSDRPISKQQLEGLQAELVDKQRELGEALLARRRRQTSTSTEIRSPNATPQARILQTAQLSTTVGMLQAIIDSYDPSGNPLTLCMGVQETTPVATRLLERGEFNRPAQLVEPGFPQVLCAEPVDIADDSSGRLELAEWIGSSDNPLTARVMVNRIWQHLFGNGIVRTSEDFGATGQPPTHPELLDFLAVSFMESGWSVKHAVRTMVQSRAYRMSSRFDAASFEEDPENQLLWRRDPKRLEAESIRDAMLAISGRLQTNPPRASLVARLGPAIVRGGTLVSSQVRRGGDSVQRADARGLGARFPALGGGAMGSRYLLGSELLQPVFETLEKPADFRSIYLPIVRDHIPRSLDVFDFAESTMVIGKRETSSTPDQGLYFLNNQFVIDQAELMANRIAGQATDLREQIKLAFMLAYCRPPSASELRVSLDFCRSFRETDSGSSARWEDRSVSRANRYQASRASRNEDSRSGSRDQTHHRLSYFCQAIMASAEFRYLD